MWLARLNDSGAYRAQRRGESDDIRDANGLEVLPCAQAQSAARAWFDQYVPDKARAALPGTTATRQRVTNDLKAALNGAATAAQLKLVIKDGLAATAVDFSSGAQKEESVVETRILADDEVRNFESLA